MQHRGHPSEQQQHGDTPEEQQGGGQHAGPSAISTAALDEWLAARGYPTFGSDAVAVGIGGYRLLSNGIMLGAEFHGLIIGDEPHEGGVTGLGGGYATLGVAYNVNISRRLRVYPRIGIGAGGMALWREDRDTLAFEDVLDERVTVPVRETVLGRDGVALDAGIGAEFRPRGNAGPLVGVRVGYLRGPFTSAWESYGSTLTGGPDASISGLYLRVLAGWAWRR